MAVPGGGGKSILGTLWVMNQCLKYPGVHYFFARRELTNLKKTTLISFFEVIQILGLKNEELFTINSQTNIINFHNGSKIFLLDTAKQPSDPLYTRFGGLLLTGGFFDESNENEEKAITILKTRCGRWKNKEYSLLPKTLEAFNPSKNHIYNNYYKLYKTKSLPTHRTFIPALVTDNPHLDENYINQLRNSDEVTKQRLLYGNFDYDDDPALLVDYDAILDIFTNEHVKDDMIKTMTTDIAMQGRDNFVIMTWSGLRGEIDLVKPKASGPEILHDIKMINMRKNVPTSRTVADSDGMGSYLESFTDDTGIKHEGFLQHIKNFHGGSKPIRGEYFNLKSDCAFKLAELIQKREIYIKCTDIQIKNMIIEELNMLKRDNIDKDDRKKSIIPKDLMKEQLGRSPDFLDCLIMRMIFEIRGTYTPTIV